MSSSSLDLNSPRVRLEIADNVRQLRLAQEISQQRLAARCGIRQNVVSRVETGDRWLDFPLLVRLAHGLGEPVAALMPTWIKLLSTRPQAPASRPRDPARRPDLSCEESPGDP